MQLMFSKLRYKNILSTGNHFTEIDLLKHSTTLIIGDNGVGKSTILDALTFVLYGKPYRKINKPQLINSINQKNLLVEIEFTVNGDSYMVRRGMKPNVFEIYKKGELINQESKSKDYQSYLEENILKMNYKSFIQIVVLGSSIFVPFMQLPAQARREIIEDLLDLQVFSVMNSLLKKRLDDNKDRVIELKHQIALVQERIKNAKDFNASVRKMKQNDVDKVKTKISEIEKENEILRAEIDEYQQETSELIDINKRQQNLVNALGQINKVETDYRHKENVILKDLKFYSDNDSCPTCKQELDDDFKSEIISENKKNQEKIHAAFEKLSEKRVELEQKVNEAQELIDNISVFVSKINAHKTKIDVNNKTLNSLKIELTNTQKEVESIDMGVIQNHENDLKTLKERQEKIHQDKNIYGVIGQLLKDGGIKTKIIRQYIPIINKLLNKYLSIFDFFIEFEIDENFNETIKSRFRDAFSYGSFSIGEQVRINLAFLFTWRAIARMRNSVTTNLLILDEIGDANLDAEGILSALKIIEEAENANILVISHAGFKKNAEHFDAVMEVKKVKNFSEVNLLN